MKQCWSLLPANTSAPCKSTHTDSNHLSSPPPPEILSANTGSFDYQSQLIKYNAAIDQMKQLWLLAITSTDKGTHTIAHPNSWLDDMDNFSKQTIQCITITKLCHNNHALQMQNVKSTPTATPFPAQSPPDSDNMALSPTTSQTMASHFDWHIEWLNQYFDMMAQASIQQLAILQHLSHKVISIMESLHQLPLLHNNLPNNKLALLPVVTTNNKIFNSCAPLQYHLPQPQT